MRKVVYSTFDENVDFLYEWAKEEYPDFDETSLWGVVNDCLMMEHQDVCERYDVELSGDIVCIATLGLWNGAAAGYKVLRGNNIKDCFECDCDSVEWYIDRYGNLRAEGIHHDGRNSYLYRELRTDLSETQVENFFWKLYKGEATSKDISRYTVSIGRQMADC